MKKLLLALFGCASLVANAQDVHFTQYFTSPLTLNPANTGLVKCDYRVAGNYRTQWAAVNAKPYQTATISADMAMLKGKLGGDALGIGILGIYDKSGTGALTNMTAGLSLAYHKTFGDVEDKPTTLSAGVQGYLVQKTLNPAKLEFGSMYDPATGQLLFPSGEALTNNDLTYPDFNAGLMLTGYANERSTYYVGGSMYHIARPEESFLTTNNLPKINNRISLSAGGNIQMNDNMMLLASALYQKQGPAREILLGAATGFILNPMHDEFTTNTLLSLGAWYRFQDAICPYINFEWGRNRFGLSYDVTVSKFSTANRGQGAMELSYVYNGCITRNVTRTYNFACPRF